MSPPYEPQHSRSFRRTPSDAGIPPEEVERIAESAAKEARQEALLQQLVEKVDNLTSTVSAVQKGMSDMGVSLISIQNNLNNGSARMDRMDNAITDIADNLDEHEEKHEEELRTRNSMWRSVVPNLLTSVASAVITAALLGGLMYQLLPAKEKSNGQVSDSRPASSNSTSGGDR